MERNDKRQLVISVHGIRDFGHWQDRLEKLLKKEANQYSQNPELIEVDSYRFGYFSVVLFVIPFFRWLVVRQYKKMLLRVAAESNWHRIDLVGHSFGTHVLAKALLSISENSRPKINTIILAGSVLKENFPWHQLIHKSVRRVVNECGARDAVLLLSKWLVWGTGMAGRTGFKGSDNDFFRNRFSMFGHSGFFGNKKSDQDVDGFMRRHWVPLLLSDQPIETWIDPRPTGVIPGILATLTKFAEPTKVILYGTLFFMPTAYVYSLYITAESQRITALAASLAAQSRIELDQTGIRLQTGALLAAQSLKIQENPKSVAIANIALSKMLDHRSAYYHDSDVGSVDLSSDGKFVTSISSIDSTSTIVIHNANSGEEVDSVEVARSFSNHALRFSNTDKFVAISGQEALHLWQWAEKQIIHVEKLSQLWDENVSFSKNDRWLAGSVNEGVVIYDTDENKIIRTIPIRDQWRTSTKLQFSGTQNDVLYVGTKGGNFVSYDVSTGEVLFEIDATRNTSDIDPNTPITKLGSTDVKFITKKANIEKIKISNDDAFAIVSDEDGYIHGWDITSTPAKRFEYIGGSFIEIDFSDTGDIFTTSNSEGIINVRETKSGRQLARRTTPGFIENIELDQTGRFVVSLTRGDTITVWDWKRDSIIARTLSAAPSEHFVLGDNVILAAERDGSVRSWNLPSEFSAQERFFPDSLKNAVSTKDGSMLAVQTNKDFRIWDLKQNKDIWDLKGQPSNIGFSSDRQKVYFTGRNTFYIVSIENREVLFKVSLPSSLSERVNEDGQTVRAVLSANDNERSRLFGTASRYVETFRTFDLTATSNSTFDQRHVELHTNNLDTRKYTNRWTSFHAGPFTLNENANLVALTAFDYVWVFDVDSGKVLAKTALGVETFEESGHFYDKNFINTGLVEIEKLWFYEQSLFVKSERDVIYKWDWKTGETDVSSEHDICLNIKPSESGIRLQKDRNAGETKVYSKSCDLLSILPSSDIHGISDSGKLVVTSTDKGGLSKVHHIGGTNLGIHEVAIWSALTGEKLVSFHINANIEVSSFSDDEQYFGVGSSDGIVTVWDMVNTKKVVEISHSGPVSFLAFDSSSARLLSSDYLRSSSIKITYLRKEDLISMICTRSIRNLTKLEWRENVLAQAFEKTCPNLE